MEYTVPNINIETLYINVHYLFISNFHFVIFQKYFQKLAELSKTITVSLIWLCKYNMPNKLIDMHLIIIWAPFGIIQLIFTLQ